MNARVSKGVNKEVRKLVKSARQAGLRVERTSGNHIRFIDKAGRTVVTTSGTPSDHRSVKNAAARLRRAGWAVQA